MATRRVLKGGLSSSDDASGKDCLLAPTTKSDQWWRSDEAGKNRILIAERDITAMRAAFTNRLKVAFTEAFALRKVIKPSR